MITLKEKDIDFSDYARFLENEENVIVINGLTGIWGLIDNSMMNKVQYCINNNIAPLEYIKNLEDDSEKEQLAEIFQVLIEEGMIKSSNDSDFEVKIKEVEFKLTNKCNLKCLHCMASSHIDIEDCLTIDEMKIIADKISETETENLLLTGGEPLIRKDIKVLLPYIREKFNGNINMITNGTLIDKDMANLLKECVNAVSISIDGFDKESTEFVRGKGVYDKIVQAITYLKEAGFKRENIILTMTCTYQNMNHEDEFYNLCDKLDVVGNVRQLTAAGRALENHDNIGLKNYISDFSSIEEDLETIREELECKIICKAGTIKFTIDEMGDLYPCLVLGNNEYKFGNLLNQDLSDIFSSEKYREFIDNKVRKSIVDNIPKCKDCNVRYFCMDSCLGVSNSYYNNLEICEARCRQIYPYLKKVIWDE
ncbi:radical SAM/SPASM domain-containing protein [Oceanirhabdus sp. W0125-5]|uniref:radical SAM/SPASM domain-containing protein n=1 Tax=Oceanirhabdus sp. W0125-5 TaxID=2999116 RepID=UPI0022F303FB|nr:radical SAM protein [Oceanirhabdus sp. W0125-5]WBW95820.1 radical SAM protein [Oceanirhabdus sp. W0125-5]